MKQVHLGKSLSRMIALLSRLNTMNLYLWKNPKEDNNDALRKSKIQRTIKSFGDNFIVYLMDDTPRTIEEDIHLLMLTIRRK